MKLFLAMTVFFVYQNAIGWQITFSCGSQSKQKISIDDLVVRNTDGKSKDAGEDSPLFASAKRIVVNKKVLKDVVFKGTRAPSVKDFYFFLEPDPIQKEIKSLSITTPNEDEGKPDELTMMDGKIHPIMCTEIETLECAPPAKGAKISKDALWAGGCENGSWIQIVEMKPKKVRLKIFHSSGEDWVQGWFVFAEGCQVKSKEILKSDFSSFDGDTVYLKRVNPKEEPPQICTMKLTK